MKAIILIALSLFVGSVEAKEPIASNGTEKNASSSQLVPYDTQQALESFSKTVHGGIMHIVAKPADNAQQIKLIQQYLRQTAEQYKKGDFSSTERFHGPDMPGLAQMKAAKTGDIRYDFQVLPNGGQIHFSTEYPQLLTALHHWFDAQIAEHGSSALSGHEQHHGSQTE
ncbi:MAG: aspartate carbamoyltransferase [Methylobacter sp.]